MRIPATGLLIPLLVAACSSQSTGEAVSGKAAALSTAEAEAVLSLVNDPQVGFEELDIDAALYADAAENIIAHRDGPDATPQTDDDDLFDSMAELDGVPRVGDSAIERLLEYAVAQGYASEGADIEVVFSPQDYEDSHLARVAELIDSAEHTLDIAMYSYSDSRIGDALEAAVERGVSVRFIFESANDDLSEDDLSDTKSGRLEEAGIDVRYVNKIMHHKFVIVDGPRHDVAAADTARVATGSGNWSHSAGTKYDENTIFFSGMPEMTLRMQQEFDYLWNHSREFEHIAFDTEYATLEITDDLIAEYDDEGQHAVFTSANFDIYSDGTTFAKTDRRLVGEAWVEAIEGADDYIWIASGHLRSRPISEALEAKRAQDPDVDIRIYLDGQEYISEWYHNEQLDDLEECLEEAETATQEQNCLDSGFYFGYQLGELAGLDVRYKYYAYRWHYSYAEQMHHKYMIIDGSELWSGSYNLSDNAETNTMENTLVYKGAAFEALIGEFEGNFLTLWDTAREDDLYEDLSYEVENSDEIPLIFESMALDWQEIDALKSAIYDNCSLINSDEYRNNPEDHWTCPRD